jgi:hypothetical protein
MRRTQWFKPTQPGEAVFRSILPEDIVWKPFRAFPPSARLAVLVGEPSQPSPYVIRGKVPSDVKLRLGLWTTPRARTVLMNATELTCNS